MSAAFVRICQSDTNPSMCTHVSCVLPLSLTCERATYAGASGSLRACTSSYGLGVTVCLSLWCLLSISLSLSPLSLRTILFSFSIVSSCLARGMYSCYVCRLPQRFRCLKPQQDNGGDVRSRLFAWLCFCLCVLVLVCDDPSYAGGYGDISDNQLCLKLSKLLSPAGQGPVGHGCDIWLH